MNHKRKRKKITNPVFLQLTITVIGFFLVVMVSIPLVNKVVFKKHSVNREINGLKDEIIRQNGKKDDLKKAIEYLESEQFVVERARLSLDLKKEGEEVIVVKSDKQYNIEKKIQSDTADESLRIESLKSSLGQWREYFFGSI